MVIYFIRHGQSQMNQAGVYQTPEVELSIEGRHQAELLAKRLVGLEFDRLLSSHYVRAYQTAQILGQSLHLPVEVSYLLHEVRNPSQIFGKAYLDETAYAIKQALIAHATDKTWHYSDEENLYEVYRRARQFLDWAKLQSGRLLVVTHAGFLKMLISIMLFGSQFDLDIYSPFNELFDIHNTAITICRFRGENWQVSRINDTPHLAEQAQRIEATGGES